MKTISFTLVLALSSLLSLAQTNIYHPFPDSNAMWTDEVLDPMCNVLNECSINQYRITGDTVISGRNYKKLTQSGYNISQSFQYFYYSEYAGAIRQEISAKKVFYFPPYPYPQLDTLLYNFNLGLGSPLPLTYTNPGNYCNPTVDKIDSVSIGNSYRKRFRISTTGTMPGDTTWLIEGVGCTSGLLGNYCTGWEHWQYLTCFTQDDSLFYPSHVPDCDYITSIPDRINQPKSVHLFPNPSNDEVTVEFAALPEKATVSILNTSGIEVLKQAITDLKTRIDIRNLPHGVYFIRIKSGEILEIKKLVKE